MEQVCSLAGGRAVSNHVRFPLGRCNRPRKRVSSPTYFTLLTIPIPILILEIRCQHPDRYASGKVICGRFRRGHRRGDLCGRPRQGETGTLYTGYRGWIQDSRFRIRSHKSYAKREYPYCGTESRRSRPKEHGRSGERNKPNRPNMPLIKNMLDKREKQTQRP